MDFSDQVVLVYLEEDNIQRAFFRVRPLLRKFGPLTVDQINEYPDNGYLRIVPDKNEQHTFKERMRALSGLCVLNLRNVPQEANKIRTNKNYSPAHGETNQFIVYSDAVQAIPAGDFYEVVAEGSIQNAVTPHVYTRVGGNIRGPVDRATGDEIPGAQQLPPDSPGIFAVTLPTGVEKLFYWPQDIPLQAAEEKPAVVVSQEPAAPEKPAQSTVAEPAADANPLTALEKIQQLDEKLNTSVNRLDAPSSTFTPPAEAPKKLTGTPLFQPPLRRQAISRSHNPLMETVENQRLTARYEAPGAQVTSPAELKDVVNPVEQFKRSLNTVWHSPDAQRQTVDVFLSMPGTREMVSKVIGVAGKDLTLTAMHAQLQDLEAERLMTLMQLENIQKDKQAAREDALKDATAQQRIEIEKLTNEKQSVSKALEQLNLEREKLLDDRDKVLDAMEEMSDADDVIRLAPAKGEAIAVDAAIARVQVCLKAQGFDATQEDAAAMLLNYALSDDGMMGIIAPTNADALDAAKAFSHALGAASAVSEPNKDVHVYSGGDAPAFLFDPNTWYIEQDAPYTSIWLNDATSEWKDKPGTDDSARVCGYTVLHTGTDLPVMMPPCAPVQAARLKSELLARQTPLPQDAETLLKSIRTAFAKAKAPISIRRYAMLYHFVAAAQNLMSGGIAAALDEGVLTYVVPFAAPEKLAVLSDLCAALPRTLEALNKNV